MQPPEHRSSRTVYDGWAKVTLDTLCCPRTGVQAEFLNVKVEHGVIVLAFTDKDELVLTEQYRNPVKRVQLELPGGGIKPDETTLEAAARELREETGHTARQLAYLGKVNPASGVLNLDLHVVEARGLTPGAQELDPLEDITVKLVPYAQFKRELAHNQHPEMSLYAALMLYELRHGLKA